MEPKVSAGTLARTIILLLAVVNQLLTTFGIGLIPIDDDMINTLVTSGWTIVAALVAWWKNNSFTKAAIAGDTAMKQQKETVNTQA